MCTILCKIQLDWYLEKNFYCEYRGEGIISIAQDLIKSHRTGEFRSQKDRETESKKQADVDMMSL